jgi:hypothetical protein
MSIFENLYTNVPWHSSASQGSTGYVFGMIRVSVVKVNIVFSGPGNATCINIPSQCPSGGIGVT